MASKPAAPSGLTAERDKDKYTITWKRPKKYSAQSLYYTINDGAQTSVTVAKADTSKNITIAKSGFFPKTDVKASSINFSVQGKYGKKWSNPTTKAYSIKIPPTPKVTDNHSNETENRTTFSWKLDYGSDSSYDETTTNKDTTNAIFTNYQWWTSLLANSELDSDKVTTWQQTGTTEDDVLESEKEIDEGNTFTGNYSYTRYFKIVARGPAGESKPAYGKHVYAFPNAPKNVVAKAVPLERGIGYRVSVTWSADESKSRPIDSISVEYAIATPITQVIFPSTNAGVVKTTWSIPDIQSWTPAATVKDTSGEKDDINGASFVIPNNIPEDQCVFVQVVSKHDNKTSPSDIVFVDGGFGPLVSPSSLNVSIEDDEAHITVNKGSELTAAFTGIYYRTDILTTPQLIGLWPANQSQEISIKLPDPGSATAVSFGAQTFLADYSPYIVPSGVASYAISNIKMQSEGIIWDQRPVPKPPANITLSSPRMGIVRVTWDWTWTQANGVEISWANHDDAWESTDGPDSYVLNNTRASAWNIAGLDVGTWYFKIRLFKVDGESTTYGTYSDIKSIKLASSPATPVLTLSPTIVQPNGKVTCYWAFSATDDDEQVQADICEATISDDGTVTYGAIIAKANNEQHKTLDIAQLNWADGSKHYIAVRIITASGEQSNNWSVPKPVQVLNPITCTITSHSLSTVSDQLYLTELPLTVSATGAGKSGITTYILERASDYHLDRPDESEVSGFKGETVAIIRKPPNNLYSRSADTHVNSSKQYYTKSGNDYTVVVPPAGANPSALNYYEITSYNYDVSIGLDDLIGPLDDGARYNLIALATDSYGQTAAAGITFDVNWAHQAVMPSATVQPDNVDMVTFITPIQPVGYAAGDVCDIYRLSPDKPELIIQGASFGTMYVDPFPSLGKAGGHRIVYRTVNGDYITSEDEFAWKDYEEPEGNILDVFATIIDFGDNQVILPYDLSLNNSWSKDFTTTKYLGGAIQGDWNPGVERTGSVRGRVSVQHDPELISAIRNLANYAGVCHVRTPDGSSYSANVNVTEDREERKINMITSFTFNITRVDSQGFDGMTYEEWSKEDE